MDLKFLKNPWVIGGGLALGLVVILASKGGSSSSGSVDDTSAVLSAQTAQNAQGLQWAATQASVNADVSTHKIDASSKDNANILSALTNMFNVATNVQGQDYAAASGVTAGIIAANTSLAREYSDNATRLATSYIGADVSKAGFASNENIAQINGFYANSTALGTASINAGSQQLQAVLGAATKLFGGKVAA